MLTKVLLLSLISSACAEQSGYVSFNLGESPIKNPKQKKSEGKQEVSLYGCNTILNPTTRDKNLNIQMFNWNEKNQVLTDVPYGPQTSEDGKKYYVSKYYMASPPVPIPKGDEKTNIGLVIPDYFTFNGDKPVQIVHLDYTILEPVELKYVEANFNYKSIEGIQSCAEHEVNFVPINIQCKNFPWINKKSTSILKNAKGASGIGRLRNESKQNRIFIPIQDRDVPLQCEVTILDDILLDYEVSFVEGGQEVKTISLTKYYEEKRDMELMCRPRWELPSGCQFPTQY